MSRLLLEDKPLIVLPSLAVELGLNEAIFLQQLHYWLKGSRNERDGHVWVYNTYEQWQEQFPFWSISTIRRIVAKLEASGHIVSEQFSSRHNNQTKWYRIDYSKLGERHAPVVQNEQDNGSAWMDDSFNLNSSIQESTSENTNRKKDDEASTSAAFLQVDDKEKGNANNEEVLSPSEHYAMMLERTFLERRGRGLYPSAKDLQAIQEVVASGIAYEEAIRWLNEAFDRYQTKYTGDIIQSFSYVKEHIFRQAYLKKERERAVHETSAAVRNNWKPKFSRKEKVPAWLTNPQAVQNDAAHQLNFEEEKRKLMAELAQYKKKEGSVENCSLFY